MIMKTNRSSRVGVSLVLTLTLIVVTAKPGFAQQAKEERLDELTRQVMEMNAVILDLRAEVAKSRAEIAELHQRLVPASGSESPEPQVFIPTFQSGDLSDQDRLSQLEENQRLISEHVDEQYQTKVESSSRYRTKLSGVVMLNAFANQGHVESEEVPNLAL